MSAKDFLKAGGLITTLKNSGQQWDAPNGWAPLQFIAIKGLDNYGLKAEAKEMATRWVQLNIKVYKSTGKLMEKYNVDRYASCSRWWRISFTRWFWLDKWCAAETNGYV